MRIGIDLDDTICRTSEIVRYYLKEEADKTNREPLDIMNNEIKKEEFFDHYLEDIYQNAEIKRGVSDVIRRLHNKGNEIYIITARDEKYNPITEEWLKTHQIHYDKIVASVYGERKVSACKEHKIDLMIDDDPYNYQKLVTANIKGLLFDDRGRYELKEGYATSWNDIEKYIERNR